MRQAPLLLMTLAALGLGGCAGFSKDGGFDAVADATHAHLGKEVKWPRSAQTQAEADAQVTALLAHPLSVEDAVQIALLNNRMLQGAFQELGISEAELVQAGRLQNPRFDLRHAGAAGQYDIEKRRFAQTQNSVVQRVAQLARDTREAFYAAVAARESIEHLQQVRIAAETGTELARRMVAAGNWNRLDQAREQSFSTDAIQSLTRARLAEESAREKLMVLLGLPARQNGQPALQLADSLPELPASVDSLPDVERAVLQERLDLQLMRMHIDELSKSLGLTKSTRFVNVLDIGAERVRQGSREEPYERGYTVTLEVPIFDSGAARIKKSEAIYAQAVDRFAQAALEARSQIRLAYAGYRAAFDLASREGSCL